MAVWSARNSVMACRLPMRSAGTPFASFPTMANIEISAKIDAAEVGGTPRSVKKFTKWSIRME